ncbi:hypothetical protein B0H17DRAFT_1218828 [Mycena rosella]|uniref:Uncharacterized protein n=1 Tax=Mycena rosella TaxID=1033263 RepID=A0AAD7FHW7_MYCRO|nr:hypothetical protein B0H17DRAFT_1218828 [Mycena rosella]
MSSRRPPAIALVPRLSHLSLLILFLSLGVSYLVSVYARLLSLPFFRTPTVWTPANTALSQVVDPHNLPKTIGKEHSANKKTIVYTAKVPVWLPLKELKCLTTADIKVFVSNAGMGT